VTAERGGCGTSLDRALESGDGARGTTGDEGRTVNDLQASGLADKQAITEVLYLYCEAVDQRDVELGKRIWHSDGTAVYEGMYDGPGQEFVAWVAEMSKGANPTLHQVTNVLIDLDGDRATSRCTTTAWGRSGDSDTMTSARTYDTWSRRDGEWRIDARRVAMQYMHKVPLDAS
jgi:hypothetical protein